MSLLLKLPFRLRCALALLAFMVGCVVPLYSTLRELGPWVLGQLGRDYAHWWRAVCVAAKALWTGSRA